MTDCFTLKYCKLVYDEIVLNYIGEGRFRILGGGGGGGGGARFRILGGGGGGGGARGPNSQQAHDVVMTSMRRNEFCQHLQIKLKLHLLLF